MTKTGIVLCALMCVAGAATAEAQAPVAVGTSGTYSMVEGQYTIQVIFAPGKLTVVEPNKTTHYDFVPGRNIYEVYNQKTDAWYGMRVLNPTTVEAFKSRLNPQPPSSLFRLTSTDMTLTQSPEYTRSMAIAEKYKALAAKDPGSGNAHAYASCAAAAFSRATQSAEDADWYARDAAERLRPIMVDKSKSPCPDAIPNHLWGN